MDKACADNARNVLSRLPPGFRFHPSDEELVLHYLRRKVYSCPLPADIIPDVELAKFDPWELPGVFEEQRYVFNLRESKYPNGNRVNREGKSGYWKATGKEKPVVYSRTNQVIGVKKVFVFYRGKPSTATRTDYIMHEYQLTVPKNPAPGLRAPSGDWVLCRVFKKKRANRAGEEAIRGGGIQLIDFMGDGNRRQIASDAVAESSCVTELSDDIDGEEETSPAN